MKWKILCVMLAAIAIISLVSASILPTLARETISPDGNIVPPLEVAPSFRFFSATVGFQSWVSDVRVVGFSIDADNQVSVSLRYVGTGTAPAVTVVVTTEGMPIYIPMKGYAEETRMPVPLPAAEETAVETEEGYCPPPQYWTPSIGSGVIKEGWSSPSTVTLTLVGNGSLYDATYLQVLLIPYTGK